jgi:hypothetical protein
MKFKKLESGYIKIERSQAEKRKAYSVDIDTIRKELIEKISPIAADAILKIYTNLRNQV